MRKKTNKKGGAFAIGMVIVVMVLMGFIWHGFVTANKKIDVGISSLENLNTIYDSGDRLSLYIKEAAKFSVYQAYYNIVKETAINKDKQGAVCFTKKYDDKDMIMWSEQCKPEQAFIKQDFISHYNKSFNAFLASYPEPIIVAVSNSLENDLLITTAETTLTAGQEASYASYNLSYDFDQSISINLTKEQICLEDFENIYNDVASAINECKDKEDIENCLKLKLDFERWDCDVKKTATLLFFECNTKKHFFFENSKEQFKEIELYFGIEF